MFGAYFLNLFADYASALMKIAIYFLGSKHIGVNCAYWSCPLITSLAPIVVQRRRLYSAVTVVVLMFGLTAPPLVSTFASLLPLVRALWYHRDVVILCSAFM
jgi:hypothetical protein